MIYPWLICQHCCSLFRSAFTIQFINPLGYKLPSKTPNEVFMGDQETDSGGEGKSKRAGKNVKNGLKEIKKREKD